MLNSYYIKKTVKTNPQGHIYTLIGIWDDNKHEILDVGPYKDMKQALTRFRTGISVYRYDPSSGWQLGSDQWWYWFGKRQ